jgi:hypothetical protein
VGCLDSSSQSAPRIQKQQGSKEFERLLWQKKKRLKLHWLQLLQLQLRGFLQVQEVQEVVREVATVVEGENARRGWARELWL